ncbi:MAG: biotin--[acetyl-CoA-carboxylase] ligase [Bacteroidota bacterium]
MRTPDTLFVGKNFLELPMVNSTNEHALSLLTKSNPAEGTVISTRNQYAGRGQIGRGWESEPDKNIALSVILYPTFLTAVRQFLLNQAISLAVFDLVEHYFPKKTKIKWPNDIYIFNKKVAGILIQNAIGGNNLRSSVIGIGLNINQEAFTSNAPNPTSFKLESKMQFDIPSVILELCRFIESRYLKLKSGNLVPLQQDYLRHLYRCGTESLFQRPDGSVLKGTIKGVSDIGQLRIEISGKEELFGLKEIKFL